MRSLTRYIFLIIFFFISPNSYSIHNNILQSVEKLILSGGSFDEITIENESFLITLSKCSKVDENDLNFKSAMSYYNDVILQFSSKLKSSETHELVILANSFIKEENNIKIYNFYPIVLRISNLKKNKISKLTGLVFQATVQKITSA